MVSSILITALAKYSEQVRNRNEAGLFQAAFAGGAVSISLIIGVCCESVCPKYPVSVYAMSWALLLVPFALIIARTVSLKFQWLTIRSNNPFTVLSFFEREYSKDIRRIDDLPLSPVEKSHLYLTRYEQFLSERAPFRTMIGNTATNCLRVTSERIWLDLPNVTSAAGLSQGRTSRVTYTYTTAVPDSLND